MKVIMPCHCGDRIDYEYDDEVEITPEIYSDIIHGKFMSVICKKCGITLKPEYPIMFTYPSKSAQIKIFWVPELQRDSFLRGNSQFNYQKTDRFVIGFMELTEKLKIFEAGLDDIVVEGVKYYILSKIENENNIENEILIYFNGFEENNLIFHIHGLKENNVGILNINKDFYDLTSEKIKDLINDEPFKSFLNPPYVSILKIYREYTDNTQGDVQPSNTPGNNPPAE